MSEPSIVAGHYFTLALKSNGTVWAWGINSNGQLGDGTESDRNTPVQVSGLNAVTAIAAGPNHSLALKSDGTVWAWGWNIAGQLGNGTNTASNIPVWVSGLGTNILGLGAGDVHSLVLLSNGAVMSWGYNNSGQLGDGSNTTRPGPVTVNSLSNCVRATRGLNHSLALKSDGTVWTWGKNSKGQLGDGTTKYRNTPVQVVGLNLKE